MSPQESPWAPIRSLDTDSAKTLVALAADVALLLDGKGKILDIEYGNADGLLKDMGGWIGKDWLETVSADSRRRIESLLREATGGGITPWIQVKHVAPRRADIPVQYRAASIGASGLILAVGRELLAMASLQQQLVDAQQAIERDYWRYREMETRYRLLSQMLTEGTLVLEASTFRVVEANAAAERLLGRTEKGIVGRPFTEGFDAPGALAVKQLLSRLVPGTEPQAAEARTLAEGRELSVSASMIRQGQAALYLIRLTPAAAEGPKEFPPTARSVLDRAAEDAPDCIVVTDEEGQLLAANPAFFELVQLPPNQRISGENLDRWLGRSGVDLRVLLSNLKKYKTLRLFRTSMRGEIGASTDVEVSAASIEGEEPPQLAFFIRDVGRRLSGEPPSNQSLPMWLEDLNERVGHAPLKDLVRESTEQIERLCIEAALKLTEENRASAAELLGLSRQSLYVKLARYGLGTSASGNGSTNGNGTDDTAGSGSGNGSDNRT